MGVWVDAEFTLPDDIKDLAEARDTLLETFLTKQDQYHKYQLNHPEDKRPERSAEHYAARVAYAKWQHAYYKFKLISRRLVSAE